MGADSSSIISSIDIFSEHLSCSLLDEDYPQPPENNNVGQIEEKDPAREIQSSFDKTINIIEGAQTYTGLQINIKKTSILSNSAQIFEEWTVGIIHGPFLSLSSLLLWPVDSSVSAEKEDTTPYDERPQYSVAISNRLFKDDTPGKDLPCLNCRLIEMGEMACYEETCPQCGKIPPSKKTNSYVSESHHPSAAAMVTTTTTATSNGKTLTTTAAIVQSSDNNSSETRAVAPYGLQSLNKYGWNESYIYFSVHLFLLSHILR
ncbi:unnamed protein product [Lepeophtheirus salmonis]|uniref:(salmon louse) hypothetical protein n=1 Tax=Lepeophtheirus salmonis TaxID=72036 RepID=A0A7R8HDY1_LEPSM|nr:unnamed protein product [Lepeophtheirus salmonis]CAF3044131.1 unnamed protein product [Lepeophtheirus salmonis]